MAQPEIMRWFDVGRFDEGTPMKHIAEVVQSVAEEALTLPESAERSTGLRKLLEAKDALVRAAVALEES